jgi:hypothetical protein
MKKLKQIFNLLTMAIIAIALITSCGGETVNTTVSQLEKCLGSNKTNDDLNNLSKEQAIEIAKCMLEPMENIKEEVDNMSSEDQEKFGKEFTDAINKSEYKEVLKDMDYDKIKELASLASDNEDNSSASANESSSDCDQFIEDYEDYVNNYIKIIKKMKANPSDMSIMTEYTEMASKAAEMQTGAADCTDAKYAAKLMKLSTKIANAASGL